MIGNATCLSSTADDKNNGDEGSIGSRLQISEAVERALKSGYHPGSLNLPSRYVI